MVCHICTYIYNTLILQEKYAIRVARLGHGAPLGGAEIFILGGVMSVIYLFEKTFLLFPDHPFSARRGVFVFQ